MRTRIQRSHSFYLRDQNLNPDRLSLTCAVCLEEKSLKGDLKQVIENAGVNNSATNTLSSAFQKKLPLTALAQNMQEASTQLEESLLGKMLETCGDAENQLALELAQHEVFVEREIVEPLGSIAEMEIPNIQKQRKQLAKLVLDWDSVRAR